MKKKLTALGLGHRYGNGVRRADGSLVTGFEHGRLAVRRGKLVRQPAHLEVANRLSGQDRRRDHVQPERLRRAGSLAITNAASRLRRQRRTALAGSGFGRATVASDPMGARGHGRHVQHPQSRRAAQADGRDSREHLPRQHQAWNATGDQQAESQPQPAEHDITPVFRSDGSGTSYNFTDYLSAVSPDVEGKVRYHDAAAVRRRNRGPRERRRRWSRLAHRGRQSATRTPRSQRRTASRSRRCRTRPASSRFPA